MGDGIVLTWLKKFVAWQRNIRWKVVLPYLIILVASFLGWRFFETSTFPNKDIYVETLKAVFLFSMIRILLEESPIQEKLLNEFSSQKLLLQQYVEQQNCCRGIIPALAEANIAMIFPRRTAIKYDDINYIFKNDSTIKVVGTLLSEFVDNNYSFPDNKNRTLRDILQTAIDQRKTIQVLLLDPYSNGAYLKSKAMQEKHDNLISQRVCNIIEELEEMISRAEHVEIRLCRTFPAANMVLTDSHAFIQPSIFHNELDDRNKNIPMIKYVRKTRGDVLFADLENHFDTVWRYDSISIKEFQEHEIGTHQGLIEAKIKNIYIPRFQEKVFDPVERMKYLIETTREILWIKQVSLFQILNDYGYLSEIFSTKYKQIKDIRLLLIDPECEQAKMRSYREYRIQNPRSQSSYTEYLGMEGWRKGPLYRDTMQSIENAKHFREELNYQKGIKEKTIPDNSFKVKKFSAAPDSSIIITDTAVLFEPLHYGSQRAIFNTPNAKILSGDMPMLEFSRDGDGGVYELLKNNIQFVFDHFSEPI